MLKLSNTWCYSDRTLIYSLKNGLTSSPSPKYPLSFSLHSCTSTSDSTSFPVSYLIHNLGFSTQSASKLCSTYKLRFKTHHKPDSVLNFFRNHGFSDSQLRDTIAKAPWLLSCDPSKRVLPKFQFFLSKGASNTDIVNLVSKSPAVLCASLENQMVPTYEFVYRLLKSHKDTFACALHNPTFFGSTLVSNNIRLLIQNGMTDSNITRLLPNRSLIFCTRDMLKLVEELKDLGFNPSKTSFRVALVAKISVGKTKWKEKVDAFKKWGWSDEDVVKAFRRGPHIMIISIDKINSVISFWVNQLGWDALTLAKGPIIFSLSLEKRIIPRAHVLQFLLKKGLRKKNASLTCPFTFPEKSFLDTYIKCFEKESPYLLQLYEEKLNLAYTTDKTCL